MSGDVGDRRPRPDLSAEGHTRRQLLAELRSLEALGFTRAEALDRLLGVSDTDAAASDEAPSDASDEAPAEAPAEAEAPSFDPDEVAAVALRRKRPAPPAAVADVLESLRRRGR